MAGDAARPGDPGGRRRRDGLFGAPAEGVAARPVRPRSDTPPALRRAALLVGLQGLALAALAGWLVFLLVDSSAQDARGAIGEVVFVLIGVAGFAAAGAGLWRVASWARGLSIVLQLLLAVVGYTMAFQGGLPAIGVPLLATVAAVFYLLATPDARLAYYEDR